ncbi:MAG: hypothetical protein Q8N88_04310 [Nanoarchaeota archaeon]|nr:hypothetical protein [Nanoarchaeota archaeon]
MAEEYQVDFEEEENYSPTKKEVEEILKEESPTGDPILDIHLRYNYTPKEIEFLQDETHSLIEGKSWRERLASPEINEFIAWRRQENLKKKNENQKEENPFED